MSSGVLVEYPCSDGKPMAETEFHIAVIMQLIQSLRSYYASRQDAYVVGNIFWYWEEGNPRACRSPDTMVVFGVNKEMRRSFQSWNENGAIPSVCFEIASESTWRGNLTEVRADYERVGVREYYVFDPLRENIRAGLVGYRLRNGVYQEVIADAEGGMVSRSMGLRLVPDGLYLRLVDVKTGQLVLTPEEQAQELAERERKQREQAQALAEREREQREQAQASAEQVKVQNQQLLAEIERLKAEIANRKGT